MFAHYLKKKNIIKDIENRKKALEEKEKKKEKEKFEQRKKEEELIHKQEMERKKQNKQEKTQQDHLFKEMIKEQQNSHILVSKVMTVNKTPFMINQHSNSTNKSPRVAIKRHLNISNTYFAKFFFLSSRMIFFLSY